MKETHLNQDIEKIEKELVAEQPGLMISFVGIFLALFIGFAIRSALAPEKIIGLIEHAAQKIDVRLKTHVASARISLADGIFPEIAVIVKGLSLESEENCWMRPMVEIDELKLPIDMFRFLNGEILIHEVMAHEVAISIRSDLSNCNSQRAPAQVISPLSDQNKKNRVEAVVSGEGPAQKLFKKPYTNAWENFTKNRDSIDLVHFDRIRVHYLPKAFTSFEVRDLNVNIESKTPKIINANGILQLAGETLSGDYSSAANLKIAYNETEKSEWNASIDGNWREGHYLLRANYSMLNQNGAFHVDMNQIPLNQLLPLLRKYHLMQNHYNAQQIWLSIKGGVSGSLNKLKELPAVLDLVKIEGNLGELETRNVVIDSLDPFRFKPIEVDIKSLKIEPLLTFLNLSHPHPALGKLGEFHGKAYLSENQSVKIKGEHSGLEFIFSSGNDRQMQKIALIQAEIQVSPEKWKIKIDRIKPEEGVFLGHVLVETDSDWGRQDIRVKIDEMTLAPSVQKVISDGGQISSVTGDLNLKLNKGQMSQISGDIVSSGLKLENMLVKRSKIHFSTSKDIVLMDWIAQGLVVSHESDIYRVFSPLLNEEKNSSVEVPFASSQFKTRMLKDFQWKDFNFNYSHQKLRTTGGWNEKGELAGTVLISDSNRNRQYKILGTRGKPLFSEIKK